jgi:sortase A
MKIRRHVMILLLIVSLGMLAKGAYIPAKAIVAQWLLDDAWQKTLVNGDSQKPWSWADTWPVAMLVLPNTKQPIAVLADASGRSLAFGPGMMGQSSQPGKMGVMAIAGHRDTHFDVLAEVKTGELIEIQDIDGRWHRYKIETTEIVDSEQVTLSQLEHRHQLVLVTCYPFNQIQAGGRWRYLVYAEYLGQAVRNAGDRKLI